MAKKNGRASKIVALKSTEGKILHVGEDRLDFLNNFPRVKPALDGYVEICATRLAIAGVTNANILPEREYLTLPQGTAFLTRYYGNVSDAMAIDEIRQEARQFDASNVSKAVAPAAGMISRLYRQSGNLDQAHRNRILAMLSSLSLAILLLTLKISGSPGPNYQMMRRKLRATYIHEPLLKDILGLVIDFDKKSEYLLMLHDNLSHQGVEQQIDFLIDAAQRIKKLIIDACIHLEEQLLNRQYGQAEGASEDHLLSLAVSLESATSNNQQRVAAALLAAEEIVDPGAAFDKKLAESGQAGQRIMLLDAKDEVDEEEPEGYIKAKNKQ